MTRQLAELADVSEPFVRFIETGKQSVQLDKLESVLAALGIELRAVLRGSGLPS